MLPFVEYSVFSESLFYFLQLRSTACEWLWVDDGVSEWVELKAQEHGKERFTSWHDRAVRELLMDWLGCPLRQGSARLSTDQWLNWDVLLIFGGVLSRFHTLDVIAPRRMKNKCNHLTTL
ncbi:MAG: hypothetical protein VX149_10805 [Pseudomonadota bacterium]|nr:hypothetical protein [Pseudomonadota bacterium]